MSKNRTPGYHSADWAERRLWGAFGVGPMGADGKHGAERRLAELESAGGRGRHGLREQA